MNRSSYLLLGLAVLLVACSGEDSSDQQTSGPVASIAGEPAQCVEPENPYNDDGGHDAGFKWAEEKGEACDGNSDSFNEGCEEYYTQRQRYEECEAQRAANR